MALLKCGYPCVSPHASAPPPPTWRCGGRRGQGADKKSNGHYTRAVRNVPKGMSNNLKKDLQSCILRAALSKIHVCDECRDHSRAVKNGTGQSKINYGRSET